MTTTTVVAGSNMSGNKKRLVHEAARNVLTQYLASLDAGGGERLLDNLDRFQLELAEVLDRCSAKQPDYTLARSILGDDFVTPEEIMEKRSDIVYSPAMIVMLADTIPSTETLNALKGAGQALMPHPPEKIALLAIRAAKPEHFYSKTGGWYEKVPFASNDLTGTGWYAGKKTEVAGSTNKAWEEQIPLLSNAERVPNASEMAWFITTFYEVRGVRLFPNVYVRTSSLDSFGDRVLVGGFDAKGLHVNFYWDNGRRSILGLASAWKF